MTTPIANQMLSNALPGKELATGKAYARLRNQLPQAWKFWKANGTEWAVFCVSSDRPSSVDIEGAKAAKAAGVTPVFIADCFDGLKGVAKFYRDVQPCLICHCGGVHTFLKEPGFPNKKALATVTSETRVPLALLDRVIAKATLTAKLRRALVALRARYTEFLRNPRNVDVEEQAALKTYSSNVLDEMGLKSTELHSASTVRTIESGQLGARRDHFFHSFQNYFFGLEVIADNLGAFEGFWPRIQRDDRPDTFDVWFLTALWHDTGYALEKSGEYFRETIASESADDDAKLHRQRFLERPAVQDGMHDLSSLSAYLLFPGRVKKWNMPSSGAALRGHAGRMLEAYNDNVHKSHGALGALRLVADFADDLSRLDDGKRNIVQRAIHVAGCSMPFHDYAFRESVRARCGTCVVNPDVLPFAALLAFVDSIQDDRRDLLTVSPGVPSLERLEISSSGVVRAQMNYEAVPDEELLLKIVEARDILAMLQQSRTHLKFEYPKWMTF